MRFAKYLQEEYFSLVPGFGKRQASEVFVDPSKAEIRFAGGKDKEVRYLIDMKKKKFYVWHGFSALHHRVLTDLGYSIKNPHIRGLGKVGPSGVIITEPGADAWATEDYNWHKKNEKWLSKYLDFKSFDKYLSYEGKDFT